MRLFWECPVDNKENIAVIELSGNSYTYAELEKDVQVVRSTVQSSTKQLVLILAKNNYQTIVNYLAVLQNKDVVMLLNPELEQNLLNSIIDSYKPNYIVGEVNYSGYSPFSEGILKRNSNLTYTINDDLALLLSTSGTTGSVKFVRLSYKNINENTKAIVDYLDITSEERGLANLPIHYSFGLSIINSHLFSGATLLLTDESVTTRNFWEFIKSERATSFAGVPYTFQMLYRMGFHKMELPSLRYITQAGGRLNEKLVRHFGEYAKEHNKQFFVMYGQTEAAPRISYVPPNELLSKPTSIGMAIPGGKLSIDRETNELIYEGPNVMMGYAESYHDLSKGDELQGKLYTGDIGEVDKEGFFYITGRMKRFSKLFGLRLNLDDIEKQIESTLNIEAVCIGSDDKIQIVILNEQYKEKVQSLIEELYKLHKSAYKVKTVNDIPRLSNGKVNYELLKDLLL